MHNAMADSTSDIILITTPSHRFLGVLASDKAPQTVAAFRSLLPYTQKLIHVRWSGEGMWIPLGSRNFGIPLENQTAHPAPGELLFYPGGVSETEIIWAYGGCAFASKMGMLAGNHFLTIIAGLEGMRPLGEKVLWEGAQEVRFETPCTKVSVFLRFQLAVELLLD